MDVYRVATMETIRHEMDAVRAVTSVVYTDDNFITKAHMHEDIYYGICYNGQLEN